MANMIPIQTVTVGSGGASAVEFNNIPQIYTDLVIKYSARASAGTNWYGGMPISFNGTSSSTSSNQRGLYGTGSAVASETYSNTELVFANGGTSTSNTFANGEIYIPNYTSSNYKSISADMVTENNATAALAYLDAALWSNTSPITSIKIAPLSGTIAQYSSATLYGIRKY